MVHYLYDKVKLEVAVVVLVAEVGRPEKIIIFSGR
jgi:hypothetical protein